VEGENSTSGPQPYQPCEAEVTNSPISNIESLENLEKIFVEISPVKLNEALQALTTLKLYEEQQTSFLVDPDFSRMLRNHERKLLKRHMKGLKQRDLRDWLGRG